MQRVQKRVYEDSSNKKISRWTRKGVVRRSLSLGTVIQYALLCILVVFTFFVIIVMVSMSLRPSVLIYVDFWHLIPWPITLSNYQVSTLTLAMPLVRTLFETFVSIFGILVLFMLPTRSVHIMWLYNKEIFAKVGVQPPTTWDEFAEVCAKIKAIGVTPVAINYSYQLPQWLAETYFDQYHIDWIDQVRAQEGDWDYDPNLDGKFKLDPKDPNIHSKYTLNTQRFLRGIRDGKLRFDTPAVADMVKNMVKLFPKYATSDVFVIQDTYTPFLQQKVAMIVDGTWELVNLHKDLQSLSPDRLKALNIPAGSVKSFDWDTFEAPAMQGPLVNSPVRTIESSAGEYLSIINKNQQQVNLAIDFLQFWTCQKGYKPYNDAEAKSSSFAPGGPLQVRGVQDPAIYQQYFSKVKQTGNAEVSYNHEWLYWGGGNIGRDVRNMYQQALQGQLTPDGFGKALQQYLITNFDALLKQYQLTKADLDNVARQPGS
jgi:raffinose/stachyose/melibiose transport system substrate-binding protein